MKKENSMKALSILLVALISLSTITVLTAPTRAVTDAQIENAIVEGIKYLTERGGKQNPDGSWGSGVTRYAYTGLVLIKLQMRAYELGYASPFDPGYIYSGNVTAGWSFLFSTDAAGNPLYALKQTLSSQDHTGGASGTVDNPDTNLNGYGIYIPGYDVYGTGIVLMALQASGTPSRPNDGAIDYDGDLTPDTFLEIAQDMADWLAWAQSDFGPGEGGWAYGALDNAGNAPGGGWTMEDNSNSGYAMLGLAAAEAFGCTLPSWVKTELNAWITAIQDTSGGTDDGGSWYRPPGWYQWPWVNELKAGNLIFEMTFYGEGLGVLRFDAAMAYIVRHWNDRNTDPGWQGDRGTDEDGDGLIDEDPWDGWDNDGDGLIDEDKGESANYQAMFCLMKGFEYSGIDLIDLDGDGVPEHDWYAEFATLLVNQQNADGSWYHGGYGDARIDTAWALLTLEKVAPPHRNVEKKVYVELLRNGDFSNGLTHWKVRVENGSNVLTYDGPTWLATRPLGSGWTDVNLVNEVGWTNVLDIIQTVSDGDGDWTGAYQMVNKDVSGFSELYFEADGKAIFQSLAGDGWVGGEYPVHFIIQYEDVNGIQHDTWLSWPANPAWQQGFYYLAGNQPDEPYSNQVTQNVWFHYKSPNLMNLSPAPKTIKTVRLYSSGWAYHGRIDNAQLYGTPPSANLGDVIHVKLEVTVPSGETATVVDALPSGLSYLTGTFTVNSVPATPTFAKIGPAREVSYAITEPGTHLIEFDCKVDEAKNWIDTEVDNVVTVTWYNAAGEVMETKEDVECFIIHAFEELHKNVGIPKKVKVIPAPVQFWREFIDPGGLMGVTDIIVSDPPDWPEPVALVRDYAILHKTEDLPEGYIPLELLTWEGTQDLPGEATWVLIDTPDNPCILAPGEVAEYDIYTDPAASAVLVRYTVAWESTQSIIESHFINEAILESSSPQVIVGQLSNFDVQNDYHEPVDNFELELYGIQPSDIVDWFPGWGAPPQINPILGDTEIIWMDPAQPVQPCEWVHFGLHLKPDVIATGIKAYWTQLDAGLTIKEKTDVQWRLEIEVSNPFPYTMTDVVITDRFGAEIEIDVPFPYSITHGTASCATSGRTQKVFLTWNVEDLLPGETARLILLISTDINPGQGDCDYDGDVDLTDFALFLWSYGYPGDQCPYADFNEDGVIDIADLYSVLFYYGQKGLGKQEYSESGLYELNSGATLKFIDPEQDMQLSAVTAPIYVTVVPGQDS